MSIKIIVNGEKICRNIHKGINKTLADLLVRENLSTEEKTEYLKMLKSNLDKDQKWEEDNQKFWYKYGQNVGEIKGMLEAAGIMAIGLIIAGKLNK